METTEIEIVVLSFLSGIYEMALVMVFTNTLQLFLKIIKLYIV